ncbi:MAG: bile acid:sodium symporter family protein [Pirellulales bacterium]
MLQRYLLIWLSLLCLLAFQWESLGFAFDPFVASAVVLNGMFAVSMLAIGWLLPRDELRQVFARWPVVLGGTAIQYISMPLLAYLVGRGFGLTGSALVGITLVGCVPGAMASNVLTLVARGNVSYSLSLTTSATLLSPLCVPLAMWLALGTTVDFPALQVSWQLLWMLVLPVTAGHLLATRWDPQQRIGRLVGTPLANLVILWIIAVVVALNRDRLHQLDSTLLVALLAINVGGYLAGYGGGRLMRLPDPMRRALTLEIGMQNAGLGAVLSRSLFPDDPAVAIAPAMYTFGCMLTGTVLARFWAMASARDEEPESQAALSTPVLGAGEAE